MRLPSRVSRLTSLQGIGYVTYHACTARNRQNCPVPTQYTPFHRVLIAVWPWRWSSPCPFHRIVQVRIYLSSCVRGVLTTGRNSTVYLRTLDPESFLRGSLTRS